MEKLLIFAEELLGISRESSILLLAVLAVLFILLVWLPSLADGIRRSGSDFLLRRVRQQAPGLLFLPWLTWFWRCFLKPKLKGKFGNLAVAHKLSAFKESHGYYRYLNLLLPGGGGDDTIDFVLFSPYGVFVIGVISGGGFIVGGEDDDRWKQVSKQDEGDFSFGKEYDDRWKEAGDSSKSRIIQNMLRKTRNDTGVLRDLTGLPEHCFHPVVVAADNATFHSPMPHNVIPLWKLRDFIKARGEIILTGDKMNDAIIAAENNNQGNQPERYRKDMRGMRR